MGALESFLVRLALEILKWAGAEIKRDINDSIEIRLAGTKAAEKTQEALDELYTPEGKDEKTDDVPTVDKWRDFFKSRRM